MFAYMKVKSYLRYWESRSYRNRNDMSLSFPPSDSFDSFNCHVPVECQFARKFEIPRHKTKSLIENLQLYACRASCARMCETVRDTHDFIHAEARKIVYESQVTRTYTKKQKYHTFMAYWMAASVPKSLMRS